MQNDALGMVRRLRLTALMPVLLIVLLVAACSGPESGDDHDPTPTPLPTATATSTPEPTSTPEATATPEVTETATESAEGAEGTAAPDGTPGATGTATGSATGTATSEVDQPAVEESLPTVEMLPIDGYSVVNEGPQTAIELAQPYADSSEHLTRLNQWGFQAHYFREFTLQASVENAAAPGYVLTTVNVYGSPEQAAEALEWLRNQNHALGHEFVEPPPELGDEATASSVNTADGTPTAIEFVRVGPRLYAAFAQAGDPLPFVQQLSEAMIQGLSGEEGP